MGAMSNVIWWEKRGWLILF